MPQSRYEPKNHSLFFLIGPPIAGLKSQSLGSVVASFESDTLLVDWKLAFVKLANSMPWNSFPPCFGMAFCQTPALSAWIDSEPTSTVYSWTAALLLAQITWPPPGVPFMLL